ncbi:MAG: hydrogenase maturation protease [Chloroflexota bacterium]
MDRESEHRVVVLGVGNELLKDEGVGVHTARALTAEPWASSLEVIESGSALDALPTGRPISKLVVVDAVCGGGEPGSVYRFTPEDVELEATRIASLHELNLFDALRLNGLAGIKPAETVIIGVEPKDVGWGIELSAEVESRLPEVLRIVREEVGHSREKRG